MSSSKTPPPAGSCICNFRALGWAHALLLNTILLLVLILWHCNCQFLFGCYCNKPSHSNFNHLVLSCVGSKVSFNLLNGFYWTTRTFQPDITQHAKLSKQEVFCQITSQALWRHARADVLAVSFEFSSQHPPFLPTHAAKHFL